MSTSERLAEALEEILASREVLGNAMVSTPDEVGFADLVALKERINSGWAKAREVLAAYRSTPADGPATPEDMKVYGAIADNYFASLAPDGGQGVTPLTEEQLWAMRRAAKDDPRTVDEHWFILFARAIEAAYRIGTPASTGGEHAE